jgi:hypothetical protein
MPDFLCPSDDYKEMIDYVQPQGEYAKIDTSGTIRDMAILAGKNDAKKDALVENINPSLSNN